MIINKIKDQLDVITGNDISDVLPYALQLLRLTMQLNKLV